ncbi:YeeE/YedE family protein [Dokdonia sinensis]|uniref:YeeE/YedE family protein n=1 Tax=Dokdonia sinensis TaxID=2479847 RepID=A0A3M0H372_9FLAO|nr:YeeE/YedE thiosulfate transporter family protein [Dokdonia sinensis]RMB64126.1 YeeE/YedE family protein [Dokdonia sinensis]
MNWITNPWPWYISGPLIALIMFMLLATGKKFGMSSNLRTVCAAVGAGRTSQFFRYDWRADRWNLMVVLGAIIGGFLASNYMSDNTVIINPAVAQQLSEEYNIQSAGENYLPLEIFGTEALSNPYTIILLIVGGVLVGFGARYAGGCTSGHAISGLSNLQLPSLIAVVGFFIGGLSMVHLIFPLIF